MAKLLTLPKELQEWKDFIRKRAVDYGLDFFEVIYEMVGDREVSELAALGGFPTRYPHWRFGMEYDRLAKHSTYGLSKIYEMVINTDPCYAYLLTSNSLLEQKLVMAHVYGHSDFFKNNIYFAHTNRRMLDEMANHAVQVRRHQEKYGVDAVEDFMDACLSLENLIDYHAPAIKRNLSKSSEEDTVANSNQEGPPKRKNYLEKFVKEASARSAGTVADQPEPNGEEFSAAKHEKIPASPQRDVLGFLLEYAPLKRWQQDCLEIIRDEAIYFAPQAQTKIMNEGWASFWHTRIMTSGVLNDAEIIDYADVHSGTTAVKPGGLNPYKLGIELFRDIEERWNKGQFGREYEECNDYVAKGRWDKKLGQGLKKIFEVRKLYNDITFIDEFMTEDFCRRQKLFSFAFNARSGNYEIDSREFKKVKAQLLEQLTNFGQPLIEVIDANFENKGALLLNHTFDGRDLRMDYAQAALKNLRKIWGRPVVIKSRHEEKSFQLSWDGKEFQRAELE